MFHILCIHALYLGPIRETSTWLRILLLLVMERSFSSRIFLWAFGLWHFLEWNQEKWVSLLNNRHVEIQRHKLRFVKTREDRMTKSCKCTYVIMIAAFLFKGYIKFCITWLQRQVIKRAEKSRQNFFGRIKTYRQT